MEYYNVIASGYDQLYGQEQEEKLAVIAQYLTIKEDALLLDVGCGTGLATRFFACKSVGVDSALEIVKYARGPVICGRAEELPFKEKQFDIVLCITVLHHAQDYEKTILEMKRVMRQDGKLVVSLLKKAQTYEQMKKIVLKHFQCQIIDTKKDMIFIAPVA